MALRGNDGRISGLPLDQIIVKRAITGNAIIRGKLGGIEQILSIRDIISLTAYNMCFVEMD